MILGDYNRAKNEVTIEITVGSGRRTGTFAAVLDTGFTDYLMVPQSVADDLQLLRMEDTAVTLGDGRASVLPTCEAEIEWHGKQRVVRVYVTHRADPLVGM